MCLLSISHPLRYVSFGFIFSFVCLNIYHTSFSTRLNYIFIYIFCNGWEKIHFISFTRFNLFLFIYDVVVVVFCCFIFSVQIFRFLFILFNNVNSVAYQFDSIQFSFHIFLSWFFLLLLWLVKDFFIFFLLFSLLSICFHLLNFFIRFLSNQIISVFRNNAQSNRVQSVLLFVSLRKNNLSCSCSLFLVTTNPRMCLFSFYSFCCWLFHLNLIKLVFCLFDCEFHIAHLNLWSKLCPSLSI